MTFLWNITINDLLVHTSMKFCQCKNTQYNYDDDWMWPRCQSETNICQEHPSPADMLWQCANQAGKQRYDKVSYRANIIKEPAIQSGIFIVNLRCVFPKLCISEQEIELHICEGIKWTQCCDQDTQSKIMHLEYVQQLGDLRIVYQFQL